MTAHAWCRRCGVRHEEQGVCYGFLQATEPERYGWRVTASSGSGTETFGVLIARCGERWRARVLTLPSMLWSVPGGRSTMKFVADTAGEAEDQAREFIGAMCTKRGLKMTEVPVEEGPGAVESEGRGMDAGEATRNVQGLPVRFGIDRATQEGRTSDMSGTGLFIAAPSLIPVGRRVKLLLDIEHTTMPLEGTVIWVREKPDGGRPAGMGVELHAPPALYAHFTSKLRQSLLAGTADPVTA